MIYVKCIGKHKDKHGKIDYYDLIDEFGNIQRIKSSYIKNQMKRGGIVASNLKLSSDDRIIDAINIANKQPEKLEIQSNNINMNEMIDKIKIIRAKAKIINKEDRVIKAVYNLACSYGFEGILSIRDVIKFPNETSDEARKAIKYNNISNVRKYPEALVFVTDLPHFRNITKRLTSISFGNIKMINVVCMEQAFANCNNLKQICLDALSDSNIENMNMCFYCCESLSEIDLNCIHSSEITEIASIFAYCTKLTTVDMSNMNLSRLADMKEMFMNCTNLTDVRFNKDIEIHPVKMTRAFYNCASLKELDLRAFEFSEQIMTKDMFKGCNNLRRIVVQDKHVELLRNLITTEPSLRSCIVTS